MENLRDITRVLRQRQFRLLWLANTFSWVGDSLVLVALALFVTERTGSATDLGIVLAAHALSLVAFLLLGGVWADRLPRHRVMVVTDLVRCLLHALLAALIFAGTIEIWQLAVIEVFYGAAEAFSRPASNGLLPQTVDESDVQQATAVTTMARNVTEFAGPALASVLVLGAGAGWAFALDSATFVVSMFFLVQLSPRRRVQAAGAHIAGDSGGESTLESIREGLHEVRTRPWVWATLASFCAGLFFGLSPWFVLGATIAREQYGHIAVFGFAETAIGVGTIVGSLVGVGWRPLHPMRMAMLAIMIWPVAAILYASGITLAVVLPATVLAGAGISLFDVWWITALTERIPPDRLSRVTAYDWMVSGGMLPVGYLIAGPLGDRFGAVNVMVAGSALAFISFALGLLPAATRSLRRIDGGVPAFSGEEPFESIAGRY
ncbi:MAG TPA: MFS transporter [Solirubrobacteraceae bacterium]|nr:MFS transporter [Solirubrobacteraceae bacterium]